MADPVIIGDCETLPQRGGRPPISESRATLIKMAFERGYGVSKAARESGVHRNTARAYYARLRATKPFPERVRGLSEERAVRLHGYAWREIGKRAAAKGITGVELAALILRTIVDDNLFAAVLDDDLGSMAHG